MRHVEQTLGFLFSNDRERDVRWKLAFSTGLLIGCVVLLTLRVGYYDKMGYTPDMSPGIAFIFLPILFVPLALVSLAIERTMRRFLGVTRNAPHTFIVGGTYATIYFWWAFPDHGYLMLVFNPLVLRWAVTVAFRMAQRLSTTQA
jgi:hypothetical protein